MPDSFYKATLTGFGSPDYANLKYVDPNNCTLQGDTSGAGAWVTIPRDEYEVFSEEGFLVRRTVDDDGNPVDWSSYQAYRCTYAVHDVTATATHVVEWHMNESVTFAEDETGFNPIGPEGQVCLALGKTVIGRYIRGARGVSTATLSVSADSYADLSKIELDHGNYGTVIISTAATDFSIITIKRADDGQFLEIINLQGTKNMNFVNDTAETPTAGYAKIWTHMGAVGTTGVGSATLQYLATPDRWVLRNIHG